MIVCPQIYENPHKCEDVVVNCLISVYNDVQTGDFGYGKVLFYEGGNVMRKKTRLALLVMLLSLFIGTMNVYASDMAISKTKITVNVGDKYDLDITGTEKIPRWNSWNVNTVKVNQDGEITA